jgi:hypothetical protein
LRGLAYVTRDSEFINSGVLFFDVADLPSVLTFFRLDKSLPIVGSPYWMAPECICGKKYNERVQDLSVCVVSQRNFDESSVLSIVLRKGQSQM